ncbi:unnamed protein product, partial [Cladocopium goreaui]
MLEKRRQTRPHLAAHSLLGLSLASQPNFRPHLGQHVPFWYVFGELDSKFAEIGKDLAACSSKVHSLPCGHAVVEECPREVADLLLSLVKQLPSPSAPKAKVLQLTAAWTEPIQLLLKAPLLLSRGDLMPQRSGVLLVLQAQVDGAKMAGLGEVTPLPLFHKETLDEAITEEVQGEAQAESQLNYILAQWNSRPPKVPFDLGRLDGTLTKWLDQQCTGNLLPSVRAGLEMALLHLLRRAPEGWRRPQRSDVSINSLLARDEDLAADTALVAKFKVGKEPLEDAERTNQLAKLLLEKRPQASALDGDGDDSVALPIQRLPKRFCGGGPPPEAKELVAAICLSVLQDEKRVTAVLNQSWVETWHGWEELKADGSDTVAMNVAERLLQIAGVNVLGTKKKHAQEEAKGTRAKMKEQGTKTEAMSGRGGKKQVEPAAELEAMEVDDDVASNRQKPSEKDPTGKDSSSAAGKPAAKRPLAGAVSSPRKRLRGKQPAPEQSLARNDVKGDDASDCALALDEFILRAWHATHGNPDPRAHSDMVLEALGKQFRKKPTLPHWMAIAPRDAAFDLPDYICSFEGCNFTSDLAEAFEDHICQEHRRALEPLAFKQAAKAKLLEAYGAGLTWACQQDAPTAHIAIDRRCLRQYRNSQSGDKIGAGICLLCARRFPYADAMGEGDCIQWKQLAGKSHFLGLSLEETKRWLGLDTYWSTYAMQHGKTVRERLRTELQDWCADVELAPGSGAQHVREAVTGQAYSHRPSDSECWWLSPYEFTMHWELVPARIPHSRAEWEAASPDAWDVALTPVGEQKLLQSPLHTAAKLKPSTDYRLKVLRSRDRVYFASAAATAAPARPQRSSGDSGASTPYSALDLKAMQQAARKRFNAGPAVASPEPSSVTVHPCQASAAAVRTWAAALSHAPCNPEQRAFCELVAARVETELAAGTKGYVVGWSTIANETPAPE